MSNDIKVPMGTIMSFWDDWGIKLEGDWVWAPSFDEVLAIGGHIINYDSVCDHDGNSADDPLPQLNPYDSSTDSPFDLDLDLDLDYDPFNAPTVPNAKDPTRKDDHFCVPGVTMINGKRICKICGKDLD